MDYLGEAFIALEVIQGFGLPAMVNFGAVHGVTKDGYSFEDACKSLAERGADIVGLNCSWGPGTMLPRIERIRETVDCYVAALPVAYRTTVEQPTFTSLTDGERGRAFPLGLDPFQTTRFEMAEFAVRARDLGVNYIGTCCGAAPHHVRAIAEALGREVPASRYSPDMTLHPALGTDVKRRDLPYLEAWKD
jgi:betaine-homocysteine S-methyltransferase